MADNSPDTQRLLDRAGQGEQAAVEQLLEQHRAAIRRMIDLRLDPVLARFLGRSRFAWLADGTRQSSAKDYRLFFSLLRQRGKYWHEADPDDLLDWEAWRRRDQQPGQGVDEVDVDQLHLRPASLRTSSSSSRSAASRRPLSRSIPGRTPRRRDGST